MIQVQFKNYKNFASLCNHQKHYGLNAKWNFFATSHGKQPYDGIGRTVKKIVSKVSLKDQLPNKSFPQNLCLNIVNLQLKVSN